jgi:hypothetical protein
MNTTAQTTALALRSGLLQAAVPHVYLNQPRLLKYHMGTSALAIMRARA